MSKITPLRLTGFVLLGMVLATLLILMQRPWQTFGSVTQGNEYFATSTGRAQADFANYSVIQAPYALTPAGTRVATSVPTVLGSIIITKPGTSAMCFHDATTTVTNAENATSTRWSTCFPATAQNSSTSTVGVYTFDIQLKYGILVEYLDGQPTANTRASTTVTFR